MTETEWLACTDPTPMLEFLRGKASDRKLRVFAVACCQRIAHLYSDKNVKKAIEFAERFADGLATTKQLSDSAWGRSRSGNSVVLRKAWEAAHDSAEEAVTLMAEAVAANTNSELANAWTAAFQEAWQRGESISEAHATANALTPSWWLTIRDSAEKEERQHQTQLLRDIFGDPFRPLPPRPEAIAPLAEEIYAGKWELMPLLGEWLQEHGYWQEGEHCLDPKNQHVKGCWVVDWVTGRE